MKETQQKSMHNSNIAMVEQTYPDINILTYYLPSVKIPHLQSNICKATFAIQELCWIET